MDAQRPEMDIGDSINAPTPNSNANPVDLTNDAQEGNQDAEILAIEPEILKTVSEHEHQDDSDKADGLETTKSSEKSAEPGPTNEKQPSPTIANDAVDDVTEAPKTVAEPGQDTLMGPPSKPGETPNNSNSHASAQAANPDRLRIRAAQEAIRRKLLQRKQALAEASRFGTSSGPASRASSADVGASLSTQVDDGDPNKSEEAEHKRLASEWKRKKTAFEKKRKEGLASVEEEIEFMRELHEEEVRVRRYKRCKARMTLERRRQNADHPLSGVRTDSGSLFVPERRRDAEADDSEDDLQRGAVGSEDDVQRSVDMVGSGKGKRKVPSPENANLDVDAEGIMAAYDEAFPSRRAKKSKVDNATSSAGNGKSGRPKGKKDAKPKAKSGTKKKKISKPNGHQLTNLSSLRSTDIIKDAGRNHELGPQPTFQSKRRDKAMREMIASLPKEQRQTNQVDKAHLISSLKDFTGHRVIKQIPDIGNGESGFLLKGMKSPLKHFQILGTAFMRRRETGQDEPLGGLSADQMGLGKTVMMLANIADSLAWQAKGENVTTLIVASPALVEQWQEEIHRHLDLGKLGRTNSRPASILVYMKEGKVKSSNAENIIASHEFVLTTYNEVRRSLPKPTKVPVFKDAEERKEWWTEWVRDNRGPLHRICWARIVLDEAQAIKNRKSATSIACHKLAGTHRWALSGTPIQNSVEELYPYFRFLGASN